MGTFAWTTLCLGGYLAETMVVTAWAVFGLAMLGGLVWVVRPRGDAEATSLNWAALAPVPFLLYALASVYGLAPAKWLAWREWLLWFQMWIVFVLTLHFGRGRRHTALIVAVFAGLGVAGVVMAAYQRFVDDSWMMLGRTQATQYAGRSAGMFGIPNSLAALLELMIPVTLTGLFSRHSKLLAKILYGWVAVVFIFGLVLTGSRGGWIGLGLALMIWPWLVDWDWRKKVWGAGVILALAGAGVWALFSFSDQARVRIQPFLDGRFESSRPIIWKVALQIWSDHRWLGSGAASYNVVFDQYRPEGFTNEPDWAHNDYLNTLSDYGVVGGGLWLWGGVTLLGWGWQAVRRARRTGGQRGGLFSGPAGRVGLFLGLLAFVIHLAVDFHTKIPALAFAFAMVVALLVRDEPRLSRTVSPGVVRGLGVGFALLAGLGAWCVAAPLYQAEALRYEARRAIDRHAITGKGDLREIIPSAKHALTLAVEINPDNAQAWADLSYATVQGWHVDGGDLRVIGREAEVEARRALALCAIQAEFWVRLGVALDMQARQTEGETCFRRALELAPRSSGWWYYYAYHLQARPGRKAEAKAALETCLHLDPFHPSGIVLRQQLGANR